MEVTDQSSPICKPYLTVRSYLSPYVSPYYEQYLSPYTEAAQPYVKRLESDIVTPAVELGKRSYTDYVAPRVDRARTYGNEQWEKSLKPHIQTAQDQVNAQYSASVAPHLEKVSSAAAPYYSAGKDNVLQTYNQHILPAYFSSRPYAEKAYGVINGAVIETGYPYVRQAWMSSVDFLNRTLWPQVRILYGENVEPQLVRISERLGRYRDSQKLRATVDEVDEYVINKSNQRGEKLTDNFSIDSSGTASFATSIVEAPSTTNASPVAHTVDENKPSSPHNSADKEAEDRERISKDLFTWQEKFLKAADKGAEDLSERVQDITDKQINSQVHGVGEAFIVKLEESASSETSNLKTSINGIVRSLPEDYSEETFQDAEEQIAKAVRSAAVAIKSHAQSLRTWKQNYIKETRSLISAASVSTLDVLDNIRDLGLQEIGMRWAWMDGVTYKDWAKYHELKKAFDEWRDEVEAVATNHDGLQKGISAADELEGKGLAIAENAAKELSRLKEVGNWKVYAKDDTDDFSTRSTPAKAILAAKLAEQSASSLKDAVGQSVDNAKSAANNILSQATESVTDVASSASSVAVGTEPGVLEQASSSISEAIIGTSQPFVESMASVASDQASNLAESFSETVIRLPGSGAEGILSAGSSTLSEASKNKIKTSEAPIESMTSTAKSRMSNAAEKASSAIFGTQPSDSAGVLSRPSKAVDEATSSVQSAASSASSKVFAGAMAQNVAERIPIFDDPLNDDDDSYSQRLTGLKDSAGEKFSELTKAVSEALAKPTSTQGTVESITSLASGQYFSALAAASSALYGPEPGVAEKVSKAASDRYYEAVSA